MVSFMKIAEVSPDTKAATMSARTGRAAGETRRSTAARPSPPGRAIDAIEAARLTARRFSTNPAEQEDIAASALLGLLEHAERNNIDPLVALSQPNWRLMQCRAIDRLRRQGRRGRGQRRWVATHTEPQLETAPLRDQLDALKAVKEAQQHLDTGDLRLLQGYYVEDQTLAEVARDEGWTHGAVRRRHHRVIKKLRDSLKTSATPVAQ